MSHNITSHIVHAAAHQAHKERHNGNEKCANALTTFGLSLVLMPIPFIGIPLLIRSLIQMCSAESKS